MQGTLTRWLNTVSGGFPSTLGGGAAKRQELRQVVSKASNRAAVHGSKLSTTDSIDKEEVEKVIDKGREEKETKKKEIEKKVDAQMENSGK